jgi:hypothetical protein
MSIWTELLRDPSKTAPTRFIEVYGLKRSSIAFCNAAWKLFKKRGRKISLQEVKDYVARQEKRRKEEGPAPKVWAPDSHFLDSGAFTLWTKAQAYANKHGGDRWAYYETDEFWNYIDHYARFVRKYGRAVDYYANVDVIPQSCPHLEKPELS